MQKMYIGPTVLSVGLIKNQLVNGTDAQIKKHFSKAKEKFPLIMNLVIDTEKIIKKQRDMEKKGTPQYLALLQIMRGGK